MGETCSEEAVVSMLLPDGRARVAVRRGEACGACEARGACTTLGGPAAGFDILVENAIGARPGDRVVLDLSESAVIKASALVYLLPASTLLGGALAGSGLATSRGWPADPGAIVGCAVGLAAGMLATWAVSRAFERRKTFVPRMTRIVVPAAPDTTPE